MAGAVSAGAYTAGVIDFLIESLDEWQAAKDRGDAVPMHEISLDVFSGASAGGMCAAIAAAMVQGQFDHIHDTSPGPETTNRFYESWVNKIDIRQLLQQNDLAEGGPVCSLLDCTIIDEIAEYAIEPGAPLRRTYISPSLTLFLTLTNVTGIPYSLPSECVTSLEESALYHADRLQFETVLGGGTTSTPRAKPLPQGRPNEGAWPLLKTAAKATGAFPVFLKPREIERDARDYERPMWEPLNSLPNEPPPVKPDFPAGTSTIKTVNVDGGVIDNDPFNLAHDYLASLKPESPNNQNPRDPGLADRAVVTVAPFPSQSRFDAAPDFLKVAPVLPAIGNLISVFISQSRFFGESLALIAAGTASRYLIAPSDPDPNLRGQSALQGASLGAFGGFFDRSFRAHDFALGRRNCQQFLRNHFALPVDNPLIREGLSSDARVRFRLTEPPQDAKGYSNSDWIPLIPLCSDAVTQDARKPVRGSIQREDLDEIVDLIHARVGAVRLALLQNVRPAPVRVGLEAVARLAQAVLWLGKEKTIKYLDSQLNPPKKS